MVRLTLTTRLRALCLLAIIAIIGGGAAVAQIAGEDTTGLPNPRAFHEQEFERFRQVKLWDEPSAITRTQSDFDVLYYELFLDLRAYSSHQISGNVIVQSRSLIDGFGEVILDLCSALTVDSVVSANSLCAFSQMNHLLTITLNQSYNTDEIFDVHVYYHGIPCQTNSLFTSILYYDRNVGGALIPSIGTLSEPIGARDWWPSKNDPADKADSVRVSLLVADTLTGTSNGMLESTVTVPPSSRVFTWVERHPISTYLVCANASNYVAYDDWYVSLNGDSMPITHYVFPERLVRAQSSWNTLPSMMSFCAGVFGEYPFLDEKYGHTMFSFLNVGMEHQTASSIGRNMANGQHTYDYVLVHELAHQWFGDDVTMETWRDVWLNEGFASYSEALWVEHLGGQGAYRDYMLNTTQLGVTDPSGPVYDPSALFNSNTVYHKGAWILHMLRGLIRDDSVFFSALRDYRQAHSYSNATTAEFLQEISVCAGFDVTPYLYNYLFLINRPHYVYSFGSGYVHGRSRTVVCLRQAQADPCVFFRNKLDIRLSNWQNTVTRRTDSDVSDPRFFFDLDFEPTQVALDPDDWVLKSVGSEMLPMTIISDTLRYGVVGSYYSDTLIVLDADGSFPVWSLNDGTPPPGLQLSENGVLEGVPGEVGDYHFRVYVSDDAGNSDKWWIDVTIYPAPAAPQGLSIYPQDDGTVRLFWSPTAADSYRVYRSRDFEMIDPEWILTTTDTVAIDTLAPAVGDTSIRRFYHVTSLSGPAAR